MCGVIVFAIGWTLAGLGLKLMPKDEARKTATELKKQLEEALEAK